jgi:hypothetical protein
LSLPTPNNTECPIFQFALEQYKKHHDEINEDDFVEDYSRFWYIIKLLVIYRNSGELNVRLLLNHVIILTNSFGTTTNQILIKLLLNKGEYEVLVHGVTLLVFLGYMPQNNMLNIMNEDYVIDVPLSVELYNLLDEETYDYRKI